MMEWIQALETEMAPLQINKPFWIRYSLRLVYLYWIPEVSISRSLSPYGSMEVYMTADFFQPEFLGHKRVKLTWSSPQGDEI